MRDSCFAFGKDDWVGCKWNSFFLFFLSLSSCFLGIVALHGSRYQI
jgi:hypothetical protein